MEECFPGNRDEIGKMARGDCRHRENGFIDSVLAKDVPADFADVAGADGFFHLQYFHEFGLAVVVLPSLPECVVWFDLHIIMCLRHPDNTLDKVNSPLG